MLYGQEGGVMDREGGKEKGGKKKEGRTEKKGKLLQIYLMPEFQSFPYVLQ